MRRTALVLLCIVALCLGCAQRAAEEQPENWREIARFEGESFTWTRTFEIETSYWRVSWSTQPNSEGKKRFRLDLTEPAYSAVGERLVDDDGPDQGATIIHKNGKFHFGIDARQPYTVIVEVPE